LQARAPSAIEASRTRPASEIAAEQRPAGAIAGWLGDDRRFWGGSALLLGAIAILKGLRVPNAWSATQAYLSYQDGFVKRGLFGELVGLLGIRIAHYDVFVALSGFLFLSFIVLLVCWIRGSRVLNLADGTLVALFAASYGLTFLAHMIGYLEIPSGMLAIVAIAAAASRFRLLAILAAGVLGVLIHENYLLTFLPLTLLPSFLAAFMKTRPLRELWPAAVVVGVLGAIVLFEALSPPMSARQAQSLQAAMSAAVDFHPRADFFAVMTRSARDNIGFMLNIMANGLWWISQLNALLTFMPTAALFLWMSLAIIAACHRGPHRRAIQGAVVLVSLSPLSLQVMGMDIYRWYALAALTSFMAMVVVASHYARLPVALPTFGKPVRNLAMLLIAINMATGTGLFDSYRVDTFPFIEHWRGVLHWIAAGRHWMRPAS
jgi:hypothetical protein